MIKQNSESVERVTPAVFGVSKLIDDGLSKFVVLVSSTQLLTLLDERYEITYYWLRGQRA